MYQFVSSCDSFDTRLCTDLHRLQSCGLVFAVGCNRSFVRLRTQCHIGEAGHLLKNEPCAAHGFAFPRKNFRKGDYMPTHDLKGSDFISTLIADNTQIHTQLLAEAMSADSGLQVVASASTSAELLAAVVRVPVDVAVISYSLDDKPGRGAEVLREMRGLRPQIKGILLMDTSRPQDVLECFRAGAR